MKVGDLVRYIHDSYTADQLGVGVILGFDKDNDPLIYFSLDEDPAPGGDAFFSRDIKVLNKSRFGNHARRLFNRRKEDER